MIPASLQKGRRGFLCGEIGKQKFDGEGITMGLCPKPHQGGSPSLDPAVADAA